MSDTHQSSVPRPGGAIRVRTALLLVLAACASAPERRAGGLVAVLTLTGSPAVSAGSALMNAVTAMEKRRPYLAGDAFGGLDPTPLVVFREEGEETEPFRGEVSPFAGGPDPQVEYAVRIGSRPAAGDALTVDIRLFARYDTVEGDEEAYEAALKSFRDAVFAAFLEELDRAGVRVGVEWRSRD